MSEVLLALAVVVTVFAAGTVLRGVLLVRRRVRRVLVASQPVLQLAARVSRLAGGSPRVGALRWRLARSVDAARDALRAAVDADAPVGDLPALLARLERLAAGHDAALAALGRGKPDPAQLRAAAERVRELAAMAGEVRAGAVEAIGAVAPDDPQVLAGDISTEVDALREGRRAARA